MSGPFRRFLCACGQWVAATTREPDEAGFIRLRKHKNPNTHRICLGDAVWVGR